MEKYPFECKSALFVNSPLVANSFGFCHQKFGNRKLKPKRCQMSAVNSYGYAIFVSKRWMIIRVCKLGIEPSTLCCISVCVVILDLCFGIAYILDTADVDWIKEVQLNRQTAYHVSAHGE